MGGFGDSSCPAGDLETASEGTLTIATGEPAFPPWVLDDDPESKQGFEAAVAYAVAEQLGYEDSDVTWVRTTFDSAIAPGPKDFDFNLQQFSISDERKQAVDFSSGYYTVSQVVVSYAGSPIDGATSLAELANARFGAAVGTTSLDAIEEQIQPAASPSVFNDNAAGVAALKNKQIDGFVVDLPTGFLSRQRRGRGRRARRAVAGPRGEPRGVRFAAGEGKSDHRMCDRRSRCAALGRNAGGAATGMARPRRRTDAGMTAA